MNTIYLPINTEVEAAVGQAVDMLIEGIKEGMEALLEAEGRILPQYLPLFTPDVLNNHLRTVLIPLPGLSRLSRARADNAIDIHVGSLTQKQLQIDAALNEHFFGAGVAMTNTLMYIDVPEIVEALGNRLLESGKVALVSLPDFYSEDDISTSDDSRRDVMMGVLRWRGVYLCRPVLASFKDMEPTFFEPPPPVPTVTHTQLYGLH